MKHEHQALTELRSLEKTVEKVKVYVNKYMAKLAFHWYSVYGFPVEMFDEEMKIRNMSLLDQLSMIARFYKK